jgi:hypothetical protein
MPPTDMLPHKSAGGLSSSDLAELMTAFNEAVEAS